MATASYFPPKKVMDTVNIEDISFESAVNLAVILGQAKCGTATDVFDDLNKRGNKMAKFEIFDEKNSKEVLRFRLIKNEKYNFIHVALVDYNGEVLPDGYICTISKDGLNRCGGFNSDSIALDKGKITSRIKLEH